MGRIYTVQFSEISVGTAVQDLFQIEALTNVIKVHAVFLSQSSDEGDAESELLNIQIKKVTDAVSNVTAEVPVDGGSSVMTGNCNVNQTTVLNTGALIVHSGGWNVMQEFIYLPLEEHRPVIQIGNALTVKMNTASADALIASGTIYLEQEGN
jgi:hypothetical protein